MCRKFNGNENIYNTLAHPLFHVSVCVLFRSHECNVDVDFRNVLEKRLWVWIFYVSTYFISNIISYVWIFEYHTQTIKTEWGENKRKTTKSPLHIAQTLDISIGIRTVNRYTWNRIPHAYKCESNRHEIYVRNIVEEAHIKVARRRKLLALDNIFRNLIWCFHNHNEMHSTHFDFTEIKSKSESKWSYETVSTIAKYAMRI